MVFYLTSTLPYIFIAGRYNKQWNNVAFILFAEERVRRNKSSREASDEETVSWFVPQMKRKNTVTFDIWNKAVNWVMRNKSQINPSSSRQVAWGSAAYCEGH